MTKSSAPFTCHMTRVTCHMSCVTSHMSNLTCIFFKSKKNHKVLELICRGSVINIYIGQKQKKPLPLFQFFHSGSDKTYCDASILKALIRFYCSFAVMLFWIGPTNRWRVMGTLSIKILVLSLPETWNISKIIKLCMITRSFGQIHSMYITVWKGTNNTFLKTKKMNLWLEENLVSPK